MARVDEIARVTWDLAIFDEASVLAKSYTGENKTAAALKSATASAFKLLLTPTPITMSIMDIYGLIHFIDEVALPDSDEFYKRYFRKPESYPELSGWVSRYAFRTLKNQVTDYVSFTERIPYVMGYELTAEERALYALVKQYLDLPIKAAYPKMDAYELNLIFYHTLSSSPQALCKMLESPLSRLEAGSERELLLNIAENASKTRINGKCKALTSTLKKCFTRFKQLKLPQKALIFTDNRTTQKYLRGLLSEYGALVYSGANSRDYSVPERFRSDKATPILITTDDAVRGLDIEFCPLVINYDLLYNAIEMEQRISRCHRQGQKSDVLVINLLGKDNLSDVRILELINKRVLQFDGIFGMSDAIVGHFDLDIDEVLGKLRPAQEVQTAFAENLAAHEADNKRLVEQSENVLFTTFTKSVADKVTVTPQYIADQSAAINADLWVLVKLFFEQFNTKHGEIFAIDDEAQTVTALCEKDELPVLFYYWQGRGNRPYKSLKSFGMAKDFRPHHGRITLTSVLARGVLGEAACAGAGAVTVNADIGSCRVGLYDVNIANASGGVCYNTLVGQTESGAVLSEDECQRILNLPIMEFTENGDRKEYWLRSATGYHKRLDALASLLPVDALKQRFIESRGESQAGEIERIKLKCERDKTVLERALTAIKAECAAAEKQMDEATDRASIISAKKRLADLRRELRNKEETLFFDRMRLEAQAEEEIGRLRGNATLAVELRNQFIIEVKGMSI
ncbi:MAG TPA: helicase [Ruminococcaceae bacterium]|nr:helicase [Oscillospiraceae bacterium]